MKWKISEKLELSPGKSEIYVHKGNRQECQVKEGLRTLLDEPEFKFSMVYTGSKMVGYHFEFDEENLRGMHLSERTAMWFYCGDKKDPKVNVLYEDQVIRLLSYNEEGKKPEYWLVGRWRY